MLSPKRNVHWLENNTKKQKGQHMQICRAERERLIQGDGSSVWPENAIDGKRVWEEVLRCEATEINRCYLLCARTVRYFPIFHKYYLMDCEIL